MTNVFYTFGNVDEFVQLKKYREEVLVEPIADGKWSVREIIGHLLYWDQFNLEKMVPLMADGVRLPAFPDHDLFNEEAVSYIEKYDNVAELIDDFAAIRTNLAKELQAIDKHIKFQIENEPVEYSAELFAQLFLEHDAHHLRQIRTKLES
ncbi:DinB family protein [Radiobacillus sp. PE A8.2]|uniref:DinB family protein n=1 Tax=Radiobacillus sp. PE A8.2 TaxID=3380349 RepID=UPI003890F5D8